MVAIVPETGMTAKVKSTAIRSGRDSPNHGNKNNHDDQRRKKETKTLILEPKTGQRKLHLFASHLNVSFPTCFLLSGLFPLLGSLTASARFHFHPGN